MKPIIVLTRGDYDKIEGHALDILLDNYNVKIVEPVQIEDADGKS